DPEVAFVMWVPASAGTARRSRALLAQLRQFVERFADQSVDFPVIHRDGAEAFVEVDRRLVPVEDRPLQAAAVARLRDRGEPRQQRFAVAQSARFRFYEQIF